MNHPPVYRRLNPPTGPAATILPAAILGPMGLLLIAGGLEALQRQQPMGVVYFAGGVLILAFLCFCFALHIRAQRLWAWHLRTGRVPQLRAGGFWKGAFLGGGAGFALVLACVWIGGAFADDPVYGDLAVAAFYLAYLYGIAVVGVPALVIGWAKRAWDRSAVPPG